MLCVILKLRVLHYLRFDVKLGIRKNVIFFLKSNDYEQLNLFVTDTGVGTEWAYSTASSYPAAPVSSSGSYSPLPGGAFSYPGESLPHHPTTEPVPLPTGTIS